MKAEASFRTPKREQAPALHKLRDFGVEMTLAVGTKLGPYEIVSPLGAGGMGEVYRARDTKLNREVALKVLPEAFAKDADRMARFQREAQVLASLNHPNIASIYGLEESAGVRALVMELVEGSTLADQLQHGAVGLDEALGIARQIADGLEYAHERGIIHRDLKPANVKVRPDGTVKILDFGLAKALESPTGSASSSSGRRLPEGSAEGQNSPTLTLAASQEGMVLGTVAYMSPEQARGKPVDRRSDIWAFGVVLYEMLTGQQLFQGESVSDTLAAVLTKEPDWNRVPPQGLAVVAALFREGPEAPAAGHWGRWAAAGRRAGAGGEGQQAVESGGGSTGVAVGLRCRSVGALARWHTPDRAAPGTYGPQSRSRCIAWVQRGTGTGGNSLARWRANGICLARPGQDESPLHTPAGAA